ncbi:MAG: hypothetical protein ACUVXA_08665 [Candidatus Jordarchaeum sp.]|uniref:hypothetical protein n=1 Tax=Candidatus Jordarchaeum sp. TaxID=2823881 RepID=UPI00404932EB
MYNETNTKGIIGGLLGIATSLAGIAWIATLIIFMADLMNYAVIVNFIAGFPIPFFGSSIYNGIILSLIVPYPTSVNLSVMTSIIFVGLLIVFGIMVGLGFQFYSGSKFSAFGATVILKRRVGGSLFFACSFIGASLAGILLLVGGVFQTTIVYNFLRIYGSTIFTPIRIPQLLYTWMGLAVLGVVLIILGVATLRIGGLVKWSDFAIVTGALSIVDGTIFTILVLVGIIYFIRLASFWEALLIAFIYPMSASMTSAVLNGFEFFVILSLVGFGMLLVVSTLWTRIFLATKPSK